MASAVAAGGLRTQLTAVLGAAYRAKALRTWAKRSGSSTKGEWPLRSKIASCEPGIRAFSTLLTQTGVWGSCRPTISRVGHRSSLARGTRRVFLVASHHRSRGGAARRAELAATRAKYNAVRLHAGVGYVTPNDEHEGRGEAIRKARQAGLEQARLHRLAWHSQHRPIQERHDVG